MVTNIRKNCRLQAESNMTSSFFFSQDWWGDLPPAEEKKMSKADSTGLLSLQVMLLRRHEG